MRNAGCGMRNPVGTPACRWVVIILCVLIPHPVFRVSHLDAHPVPRRSYDRKIAIDLTAEGVVVAYHLEVDPWTIVFQDLPNTPGVDLAGLSKPGDFYEAFAR